MSKYEIKNKICPKIDQPSKKQLNWASKYAPQTTAHIRKTNFETKNLHYRDHEIRELAWVLKPEIS